MFYQMASTLARVDAFVYVCRKTITINPNMKKAFLFAAAVFCTFTMLAQPKLTKDNIDDVLKAMTL